MVFYAQRSCAYCLRSLRKIIMRFAHACLLLFLLRKNKRSTRLSPKELSWFSEGKQSGAKPLILCEAQACKLLKSKILNALDCPLCAAKRRILLFKIFDFNKPSGDHGFPSGNNQGCASSMRSLAAHRLLKSKILNALACL